MNGKGSAITPAPAICTLARASWPSGTVGSSRPSCRSCAHCRALATTPPRQLRRSRSITGWQRSTAMSSGSSPGFMLSVSRCRRRKPRLQALAAGLVPERRAGDFAQAMMDLGATICTPRRPRCVLCPWRTACAAVAQGVAEDLPARVEKPERPMRYGIAFWITRPMAPSCCVAGRKRGCSAA